MSFPTFFISDGYEKFFIHVKKKRFIRSDFFYSRLCFVWGNAGLAAAGGRKIISPPSVWNKFGIGIRKGGEERGKAKLVAVEMISFLVSEPRVGLLGRPKLEAQKPPAAPALILPPFLPEAALHI